MASDALDSIESSMTDAAIEEGFQPMIEELQWLPFDEAFQQLEHGADRDALVRLQVGLRRR